MGPENLSQRGLQESEGTGIGFLLVIFIPHRTNEPQANHRIHSHGRSPALATQSLLPILRAFSAHLRDRIPITGHFPGRTNPRSLSRLPESGAASSRCPVGIG